MSIICHFSDGIAWELACLPFPSVSSYRLCCYFSGFVESVLWLYITSLSEALRREKVWLVAYRVLESRLWCVSISIFFLALSLLSSDGYLEDIILYNISLLRLTLDINAHNFIYSGCFLLLCYWATLSLSISTY